MTKHEKTSIFVSYSHADMKEHPIWKSSRIGELLQHLRHELGADSPRSRFSIIRDEEGALRTSDKIDERLSQQIAQADIALVFLSENYCLSENCGKELREFIDRGTKVFLLEMDKTWTTSNDHLHTAMRDELADVLSSRFWDMVEGKHLRFGHPLPRIARGASLDGYQKVLYDLIDDIKAVAGDLRAKAAQRSAPISLDFVPPRPTLGSPENNDAQSDGIKIILAASTSDTKLLVDRLEGTYTAANYDVIRMDRMPTPLLAKDIQQALDMGSVFVQVFGAIPGRSVPDFENLPSSIVQHRLATEHGIEIAAWRPDDFDPSESGEPYSSFLEDLTVHTTNFEDFAQFTLQQAEEKRKEFESSIRKKQMQKTTALTDPPLVSIDAARTDRDLRDKIQDALNDHVVVDHIDDMGGSIETLAEAVRDNDAIVLVYGDEIEGQRRAKAHYRVFRRLRRQVSEDALQHIEIAFGDAAPDTAMPCPSGPGIHIIRIDDDIDPNSMNAFLEALGVQAERGVH